jgi:hypothetical protein
MAPKAPETNDISVYILWLAWTCLSLTNVALKNLILDYIFPSQEIMEVIMDRASFKFAPGLLDVLKSGTAPTISYFKTLPLHLDKIWAVYVLVLEKVGQRPRIYIGSGTRTNGGVRARMATYDHASREGQFGAFVGGTPLHVDKALKEGFIITHKGLLAWTSIPNVNHQYALRGLFLILECVFTLYFWAMKSRTKDYGMPTLCPWPRDSLTYDGLCSHFSIKEGVVGAAMNLTPEETEALDADRLEVKRACGRQYKAALGPGVHAAQSKAFRHKTLEEQRYKCTVCNLTFPNNAKLVEHQETSIHIRKAAGTGRQTNGRGGSQNAIKQKKHYCEICKHAAPTAKRLETHLKGNRHAKKLKVLASSSKLA